MSDNSHKSIQKRVGKSILLNKKFSIHILIGIERKEESWQIKVGEKIIKIQFAQETEKDSTEKKKYKKKVFKFFCEIIIERIRSRFCDAGISFFYSYKSNRNFFP